MENFNAVYGFFVDKIHCLRSELNWKNAQKLLYVIVFEKSQNVGVTRVEVFCLADNLLVLNVLLAELIDEALSLDLKVQRLC